MQCTRRELDQGDCDPWLEKVEKKPIFNRCLETAVDEKRKDLLLAFGLTIASAFKLGFSKPDVGLNYITKQRPRNLFTFQKIYTILKAYFKESFQK